MESRKPIAKATVLLAASFIFLSGCSSLEKKKDEPLKQIGKKNLTISKAVEEPSTTVTGVSPVTPKSMSLAMGFDPFTGSVVWASRIDVSRSVQAAEKLFLLFSAKQGDEDHFHIWKKTLPSSQDGGIVKITADQADDVDPVLSIDEHRVYFASNRVEGPRFTLWRTNVTGVGGITKMGDPQSGSAGRVDVSPDGKKLLLVSESPSTGDKVKLATTMWTINVDGTELTQLRPGSNPRWSPDGKKIIFDFDGQIWLMDVDGGDTTQLTSGRGGFQPYWSPDGGQIVFASWQQLPDGDNKIGIWKMRKDGSELTQLTLNKSTDFFPIWAPTNEIYFLSNRGREKKTDFGLWKLQLKGESGVTAPGSTAETNH